MLNVVFVDTTETDQVNRTLFPMLERTFSKRHRGRSTLLGTWGGGFVKGITTTTSPVNAVVCVVTIHR